MPVDVSFLQVASLGALVAVAAALLLAVVIGLSIVFWVTRRAALFRSFGIERTESGSVQFKGLFNSQQERAEEAALFDKVFGPSKFDRDDEPSVEPEQPN